MQMKTLGPSNSVDGSPAPQVGGISGFTNAGRHERAGDMVDTVDTQCRVAEAPLALAPAFEALRKKIKGE